MLLGFQILPPEIHQIILQALCNEHEPSVRAFAGASRFCYALALPYLYQTLNIPASESKKLSDRVESITQLFQQNSGFQYVNRLVVGEEPASRGAASGGSEVEEGTDRTDRFENNLHGSLDRFNSRKSLYRWAGTQHPPESDSPPTDAWQHLASLIQRLPRLLDLIFLCHHQFPSCLLEALHRHHPRCKLHIHNFFLRSLKSPVLDPYEFQLATSPCLFSVKGKYEDSFWPGYPEPRRLPSREPLPDGAYLNEAIMHMASGLAPNLKEVTLFRPPGSGTPPKSPLPPWRGFSQKKENNLEKGSKSGALRYLRLDNTYLIKKDDIKYWATCTDFSALEVFKLKATLETDLLHYLSTEVDLARLKTLALTPNEIENNDYQQFNIFIQQLRPLSSLELKGWMLSSVLDGIMNGHGTSLVELKLAESQGNESVGSIKKHDLSAIAQSCPLLRYLDLTLDRTGGDSEEAALYKILGSLPRLKCVSLTFHVSKTWDYIDGPGDMDDLVNTDFDDEFDQQVQWAVRRAAGGSEACNGAIRERLVNCALDSALGRAIFGAISAGKPEGSVSLEKLRIKTTDVVEFGGVGCPMELIPILEHLSQPMRITRCVRNDSRNELIVEQEPSDELPSEFPEWLEVIWRRIWPEKMSNEWWNDWHSLPLAEVDA
ncbi:hypothetical protein N7509_000678 [Penicillium cosmopolitanum]|uniref:F-box domain-containing protein n=1 Tax=Penicillium cosmopolitanum TaxID=1131564 RepID=A0A9W9WAR2_9EURO|nr:uncharacterized protein N7509_000678 [Penicillium cosmopolitanum]KAJ5414051.1 hypothetical protein N7509_000678 [Penicillium cosmopolitanum]